MTLYMFKIYSALLYWASDTIGIKVRDFHLSLRSGSLSGFGMEVDDKCLTVQQRDARFTLLRAFTDLSAEGITVYAGLHPGGF